MKNWRLGVATTVLTLFSMTSGAASDALGIDEPLPAARLVVDAEPSIAEPVAEAAPAPLQAPVKEVIAKLPETEIPVLTGAKQAKRAEGGSLSRILTTLGVMTVLMGALFIGLKRWAARRGANVNNPKIKVLTQHSLGPKKSLAIIHVAGESILIGVTDHNISMLKTLSLIDDEVPESVPNHFGAALSGLEEEEEAFDDEFAVRGIGEIRDKVSSRLKRSGREQIY